LRNQQFILAFGELLIPLLGFYWWKWDLHFIFLFYYLDVMASLVVYLMKIRKISIFRTGKWHLPHYMNQMFLWYTFVLLGMIAFEIGLLLIYPELNLVESLIQFLKYQEFGIPQGVVLIPLVFLMNYQQYQLLFMRNGAYRVIQVEFIKKIASRTFLWFALAGGIFLLVNLIFPLADYIWLWLIVVGKVSFDLWIQPTIEKKIHQNSLT